MEKKCLETLKEITECAHMSEGRCKKLAKTDKFPMSKKGGRWFSHADLINEWWKVYSSSS